MQDNANSHYWAGSLLFHNNAYDEALRLPKRGVASLYFRAYSESPHSKEVQLLIVKCHLKQQQLDQAQERIV